MLYLGPCWLIVLTVAVFVKVVFIAPAAAAATPVDVGPVLFLLFSARMFCCVSIFRFLSFQLLRLRHMLPALMSGFWTR